MIDLSVLKSRYHSEKSTGSLKSLHTHAETIKGRKLILARYLNIGNPQDYSQIRTLSQRYHDRDRERNLNIAGENTFAAGKESKLEWLRQRAVQERKMSKELTKPTSKSLERIPVDIGAVPHKHPQKIQFHQVVPQREAIVRNMERAPSVTILRKRVKRENMSSNGDLPDEMDEIEEVVNIVDGVHDSESSIMKGRSHTEGSPRIRRSHTSLASLEKKVIFTREYIESQTLPPLFQEAKPAAVSMNLTKLVKTKKVMAKFTKKLKEKKKIDFDTEAPFTRFQRLTHKEPERPKGEKIRLYNPLNAVFEHLKFQDFYEASPKKSLKPKNFIEHVETSEEWDTLGEVDGVQTDEKLDYQMGFTKFDVTDHFNLDDFGILEWRIRSENGSVRKVYHKKSLRIFALRMVNLERFNNDPTDLKNELRTLSILTQHPHRNIIRMISSRMKVSSEGSPDYQAYNMNGRNEFIAMEVGVVSEFGIGNLKELTKLKKKLGQTWTETELLILVKEVSSALAHCESLGIAHRNVKPSNIFFGEDKVTMKLVDYKLSLFLDKNRKTVETNIVGTPRYMSYELKKVYLELKTNKRKPISVKYDPFLSDVSSLALVILELMLISMNIDKDTRLEAELAESILSETKDVYPYLSKIIGGMLSTDLKMRPRFSEIAKLLKLPSDNHRIEAYENRYNLLTQIDDDKREWGLRDGNEGEDVDGLMLSAKIYYQLTITEIKQCTEQTSTKTLQNTLPSVKSSKFVRSLKSMKKSLPKLKEVTVETPLTLEELLKKEFLYKEMTIEFLYSCYEEYLKKEEFDNAIAICNYMREVYRYLDKNEEMKIFIFIFSSLGYLNFVLNKFTESLEFFTQANNVAKKHYGDDNLSTAITLNNLANLYFITNQIPKAKELYQKNLKVKETIGLRKELPYAISAHNLANVHHLALEIGQAESFYNQSMAIYKQHLENAPEEVGHFYLALAVFDYSCLKNREKGQEFLSSAIESFEKVNSEQKKNFLMGLANHHLGILHYCYRELTQAIAAYDEAVGFLESSLFKQDNLVSIIKDHQKRAEIEFFEEMNNNAAKND